jgi:peptide-methionine (S)-S-oxide reductase
VTFDPAKLSYEALLAWFWQLHDPTQVDGQGNDIGPQYRSAIFWHSEAQREAAERSKATLEASGKLSAPVATEIVEAGRLWPAEAYHQDYYRGNRAVPYCRYVIAPKLDKLGLEK